MNIYTPASKTACLLGIFHKNVKCISYFQLKWNKEQPNSTHSQEALQSCMEYFNILVIQKTASHTFRPRRAGWVWICLWCEVCWVRWFAACSIHFPPAYTPRSKVQYVTILRRVKYLHLQIVIEIEGRWGTSSFMAPVLQQKSETWWFISFNSKFTFRNTTVNAQHMHHQYSSTMKMVGGGGYSSEMLVWHQSKLHGFTSHKISVS